MHTVLSIIPTKEVVYVFCLTSPIVSEFEDNDGRERRISDQTNVDSRELGVLSTTASSNLGSVDTGAVAVVREEQNQDFDQIRIWGLVTHKNYQ